MWRKIVRAYFNKQALWIIRQARMAFLGWKAWSVTANDPSIRLMKSCPRVICWALVPLRRGRPWTPEGRGDHSRWASDLASVLPGVYPTVHKWIYRSSAVGNDVCHLVCIDPFDDSVATSVTWNRCEYLGPLPLLRSGEQDGFW